MGNGCSADPTDPSHIKIEYFGGGHGRPEPLRVMLHHAGIPFSNDDVSMTGWVWRKTINNTGEMGGLPIVHYQGKQMQQAMAVLRALGTEKGYYDPADWKKCAKIDWVCETWNDLLTGAGKILFQFQGPAAAQAEWEEYCTTKWRPFLTKLEAQMAKDGTRFIGGDRPSIADCVMFAAIHNMMMNPSFHCQPFFRTEYEKYPTLVTYAQTIETEFASFAASREQLSM